MLIHIPISVGELLDKITILKIKYNKIQDSEKRQPIEQELGYLNQVMHQNIPSSEALHQLIEQLSEINQTLWNIEDAIRRQEKNQSFDERFIELARQVYHTNDQRSAIKNKINVLTGSTIAEVKSYEDYSAS